MNKVGGQGLSHFELDITDTSGKDGIKKRHVSGIESKREEGCISPYLHTLSITRHSMSLLSYQQTSFTISYQR